MPSGVAAACVRRSSPPTAHCWSPPTTGAAATSSCACGHPAETASAVGLVLVVVPGRVVLPRLVALLDLVERAPGLGGRGVRTEPVLVRAPLRSFDRVVLEAEPVAALGVTHRPNLPNVG